MNQSVEVFLGDEPYEVLINAGDFFLKGDEPLSMGGQNAGPSPYDFLLVALGSCTAITLRLYAERKGYTFSHLKVTLNHEKLPNRQDKITRNIEVDGDFDESVVQRLLDIATKCPMARTLTGGIEIDNRIESPKSKLEFSTQEKK